VAQIDLNERRKLRQATTVKAGGRTYTLPVFLPASLISTMLALGNSRQDPTAGSQAVRDLFVMLFGEKDAPQAMKNISVAEATDLLGQVAQTAEQEAPTSITPAPHP
jgi:hypothetical protein